MLYTFSTVYVFLWIGLIILTLLASSLAFKWGSRRLYARQHGCQPCHRYPHKNFLGSDLADEMAIAMHSGSFSKWRQQLHKRLGKTFEASHWNEKLLYTTDVKNLQTIFALDFEKYGVEPIRKPTSGDWLGKGIFTTDGPYWRFSRDLIKPIFSRAQISNLSSFKRHVDSLLELLPVTDGEEIDIQPLLLRMYLDYSTEFLFGVCANTLRTSETSVSMDATSFIQSFDDALRGVGRRHAMSRLQRLIRPKDAKFVAACRESQSFVEQSVDEAIKRRQKQEKDSSSKKRDGSFIFIDELLEQTSDRTLLRDQLLNVFFPARDTSAIGISLVFFQLARNPNVWEKLREEAQAEMLAHNNKPLNFERLKSMGYLQNVLKEALRLRAPAATARRICIDDAILPHGGGPTGDAPILVSKGTLIRADWELMQRDPDIWGADAEQFKPERWKDLRPPPQWEYIPFMGGPRICPAQQWILAQYAYILVRFVLEFKSIENRDPVLEMVEEPRMTTQSRNGVKVGFSRS